MTKLYECRAGYFTMLTPYSHRLKLNWESVIEHDVEPTIRLLTDPDDLEALQNAVGPGYIYYNEHAPYVLAWLIKDRPDAASALALDRCDHHDTLARLWYRLHVESK